MSRPISFLSDYGLADEFVGLVHGVMAEIAPQSRVIDVTHGIPRHNVVAGALSLARAVPYLPPGVHLAIVDPEVGARRRAIALRVTDDRDQVRHLVGPDNGLLIAAAEVLGGIEDVHEISHSDWRLEPVSATFHGRDVFAPVAARLAAGAHIADAGPPLDPDELVTLESTRATVEDGRLVARVVNVDIFGNVGLDATHADASGLGLRQGVPLRLTIDGSEVDAVMARAFGDVSPGSVLIYEDSARTLAIAVNCGSAAEVLGLATGHEVRIAPA